MSALKKQIWKIGRLESERGVGWQEARGLSCLGWTVFSGRQHQNYCVGVVCVDGLVRKCLGIIVDVLLVRKQVVCLVEFIQKCMNLSFVGKR